jgi:hypothetical protein
MLPLKRHYRSSRPFSSADAAAPPRHVAPPCSLPPAASRLRHAAPAPLRSACATPAAGTTAMTPVARRGCRGGGGQGRRGCALCSRRRSPCRNPQRKTTQAEGRRPSTRVCFAPPCFIIGAPRACRSTAEAHNMASLPATAPLMEGGSIRMPRRLSTGA